MLIVDFQHSMSLGMVTSILPLQQIERKADRRIALRQRILAVRGNDHGSGGEDHTNRIGAAAAPMRRRARALHPFAQRKPTVQIRLQRCITFRIAATAKHLRGKIGEYGFARLFHSCGQFGRIGLEIGHCLAAMHDDLSAVRSQFRRVAGRAVETEPIPAVLVLIDDKSGRPCAVTRIDITIGLHCFAARKRRALRSFQRI